MFGGRSNAARALSALLMASVAMLNRREGLADAKSLRVSSSEEDHIVPFPSSVESDDQDLRRKALVTDPFTGVEADDKRDNMYKLSSNAPVALEASGDLVVDENDFIMRRESWDGSPIVMEDWKLIFFPIPEEGYSTFKQLFRRMSGHEDWKTFSHYNHHASGFKYLFNYDATKVKEMFESEEWIKALFVRDPKLRVLSAYLDRALPNDGSWVGSKCCYHEGKCSFKASETFAGFLQVAQKCPNPFWELQSNRMEGKYWPYINFIGHHERLADDTRDMLELINAWTDFGADGWGDDGHSHIFANFVSTASEQFDTFYDTSTEQTVERWYASDYNNKYLGYTIEDGEEEADLEEEEAVVVSEDDLGVEVPGFCGVAPDQEKIPDLKPRHVYVMPFHTIVSKDTWDSSPVVVEPYKLMFFAIPEVEFTTFMQLLRRLQGYPNWNEDSATLPRDPDYNGLKYLYEYSKDEASAMMMDDEWTKAMFIREPKERALQAYLNLGLKDDGAFIEHECCPSKGVCAQRASSSFKGFLEVASQCCNTHWNSYTSRMEGRFWPYINFVGYLDNAAADVKTLLDRIWAWDVVGKDGWGPNGNEAIFQTYQENEALNELKSLMEKFYDDVTIELANDLYQSDYDNRILNLEEGETSNGRALFESQRHSLNLSEKDN